MGVEPLLTHGGAFFPTEGLEHISLRLSHRPLGTSEKGERALVPPKWGQV